VLVGFAADRMPMGPADWPAAIIRRRMRPL